MKGLSILFVTPFICTSSVETVQSLIVGELPYPLEHIKEGFLRILHSKKDRKLPFYLLAGPSIAYHLCYYVIFSIIRENLLQYFNDYKSKPDLESIILTKQKLIQSNYLDDESKSKIYAEEYKKLQKSTQQDEKSIINDLKCSLIAHFLTDTITYPFQNVLYRIFLQGTRTLIDNVDGRTAVTPLITNYDSASDCYKSIVSLEGTSGLFKGFGALILQYTVQASIIHLATCVVDLLFGKR